MQHSHSKSDRKGSEQSFGSVCIDEGLSDAQTMQNAFDALNVKIRYSSRGILHYKKKLVTNGFQWRIRTECTRLRNIIEETCVYFPKHKKNPTGEGTHITMKQVRFPGLNNFGKNLMAIFKENPVDPWRLWLESLPDWDGEPRIDGLIRRYFESDSPETMLKRARKRDTHLGATVTRVLSLGNKHDECVVLIGRTRHREINVF